MPICGPCPGHSFGLSDMKRTGHCHCCLSSHSLTTGRLHSLRVSVSFSQEATTSLHVHTSSWAPEDKFMLLQVLCSFKITLTAPCLDAPEQAWEFLPLPVPGSPSYRHRNLCEPILDSLKIVLGTPFVLYRKGRRKAKYFTLSRRTPMWFHSLVSLNPLEVKTGYPCLHPL